MSKPRWFLAPLRLAALLTCMLGAPAFAASVPAPPHAPIHAARASSAMRCDGVLDESSWSTAEPVTEFYQQTPDQGAAITMKTDFRVVFDDDISKCALTATEQTITDAGAVAVQRVDAKTVDVKTQPGQRPFDLVATC